MPHLLAGENCKSYKDDIITHPLSGIEGSLTSLQVFLTSSNTSSLAVSSTRRPGKWTNRAKYKYKLPFREC